MKTDEKPQDKQLVEFVPFGTKDKIQLTIEIVKRLVAVKTKQGHGCSDEEAFRFMLMCQARKLNPFEGDAFLIGYDTKTGPSFSLITAHQAFLKRAELHPEFDGMESGTIVLRGKENELLDLLGDWHMSGDRILGGWATVYFKNRKYPMKKRVRLDRFNKQYGVWADDPAGMIVKCAEADALRSAFPTMLGGLYITEELQQVTEIPRAVFPETSTNDDKPQTEKPVVQAEMIETPAATPPPEPTKKKPTLTRKTTRAADTPAAAPKQKTSRDKMRERLAVGNYTPAVFIALAVREGWLTPEQAVWENIPEDRFEEFMREENWTFIMETLDERGQGQSQAKTERKGEEPSPLDRLL